MWQTHAYSPAKLRKKRETDLTISINILTISSKMNKKRTFFEIFRTKTTNFRAFLSKSEKNRDDSHELSRPTMKH